MMINYRIETKLALIFGVMILLWMTMDRIAGLHDTHIDLHAIFTNFIAIPAIVIYVLALIDKRNNYYGGFMSYKQGLFQGS